MTNLAWKIGVSMSSSVSTEQMSPYIQLDFSIKNPAAGKVSHHTCELNYSEFQVLLLINSFGVYHDYNKYVL